ncbi:hypothetical protein A3Q56_01256 [Intoshia linei]|uniref:Amino acid transporter n=1 Tax=Intoshia linei TaxID=1819745 RepID=A0A177BBI7_9BILA|nr:hypothetical protein A3Q56_01256 [Intoshia linei]
MIKNRLNRHIKIINYLKQNLLLIFTLFGVTIGAILGIFLRKYELSANSITLIGLCGNIFIRLLKMLILPLIVSSIISGISELNLQTCGKLGLRTIIYYLLTTFVAVIVGIIFIMTIKPGVKTNIQPTLVSGENQYINAFDSFTDLIRNLIPENIIRACLYQVKTVYYPIKPNFSTNNSIQYTAKQEYVEATNVLGIILFCVFFGIVVSSLGQRGQIMVDIFSVLNEIVMKFISIVMILSPIGIGSLIAEKLLVIPDLQSTMLKLGMYMLCIVLGLIFHGFIILPIIFFIFTRRNPLTYTKNMLQAIVTAFGTASSAATLPVTFKCLEEKNHIDPRVTRFVLPIGATVNMDGTALYEASAAIFIAQLNNIQLSYGNIITISITSTLASIGAASIPSAGLITLILVLNAVGLPIDDISLLLTIDWFLDRIRTAVNVLGDSFGAGIVHRLSKDELSKFDYTSKDETIALNHVIAINNV